MAAAPPEEDLGFLWKPKRTLRDWGQTNYNIVRNWTPFHPSKATQPSHSTPIANSLTNSSKDTAQEYSLTKSSLKKSSVTDRHSPAEGTSTPDIFQNETSSYRLRRSTKRQTTDTTWYVPNAYTVNGQGPSTSGELYGRKDGGSVAGGVSSEPTECRDEEGHNVHSSSMSSTGSFSSYLSLSRTLASARQLLSPESDNGEKHIQENVTFSGETEKAEKIETDPVELSDNGDGDGDVGDLGESEELSAMEDEPPREVEEMNSDHDGGVNCDSLPGTSADLNPREAVSEEPTDVVKKVSRKKKDKAKSSRKSYRKSRKRKDEPSINVKLWQPKYLKRSREDLNELDIGLTIYDRIVREAVAEADDEVVQRALVSHWKGTQKQILSVIKDLHTVKALEKRLKKEQAQHNQLQKDMLAVMKDVQRCNSEYQEAVSKAREDNLRQQALSVEAQIATVGLQLQANHTPLLAQSHYTEAKEP